MIKNGKRFVPPDGDEADFKTLFSRLVSAGAGRPVDSDGFPQGPWTPDLLADAISQIDANRSGIELRTVQLWFQDNDKGISPENIRWLARIFGCDDPEASSVFQTELSAANRRLAVKRRKRRPVEGRGMPTPSHVSNDVKGDVETGSAIELEAKVPGRGFRLATRTEAMLDGRNALNLPIVLWSGNAVLAFLSYVIGAHSITYSPVAGLEKQVGFLWAPSWTVDRIVFVALFLLIVSELLHSWKTWWRPSVLPNVGRASGDGGWDRRVDEVSPMCWVILGACLSVTFIGQWLGVYWPALSQGAIGNAMVDWILVAVERPDVVTAREAFIVSGFANLYSCFVYWAYLSGLLFLHVATDDFHDAASTGDTVPDFARIETLFEVGKGLLGAIFCCTVLGILSATSIKLNAAYLISDGGNILTWLQGDALTFFGEDDQGWGWLEKTAWSFITSFFVFFVTCFVFFVCLARINSGLEKAGALSDSLEPNERQRVGNLMTETKLFQIKMMGVVGLLAMNFLLLGTFTGFSVLLLLSVLLAITSCIWWFGGDFTKPDFG